MDTHRDTGMRRVRRTADAGGLATLAALEGGAGDRGEGAEAQAGAGGGVRVLGGSIQEIHESPEDLCFQGESVKGSKKKVARPAVAVAALAHAAGLRPALVMYGAVKAACERNEAGEMMVTFEKKGAVAAAMGFANDSFLERVWKFAERREGLEKGVEMMAVRQVPGTNRILRCERLAPKAKGEHVFVVVRNVMDYRIGDEFAAMRQKHGWMEVK